MAAPTSSLDPATPSGSDIVVELRPNAEVVEVGGVRLAPEGTAAQNWAFDITPAELVTGYITEQGIRDRHQLTTGRSGSDFAAL